MSYHRRICFPEEAILRLQPRAAGPLIKDLVTVTGPAMSIPYSYNRGLLVVDPRYDHLQLTAHRDMKPANPRAVVGPGWESKTA